MSLKEGATLGRYEIRSLIGAGGMGEVYRAHDPKINREVAVKVLPADFASNGERVERLEREAQAAGGLNHPNILGIYDIDSQDGTYFIVSELLVGEELRERLDDGPIPLRKAIDYAQQIVSGLAAAHESGIVHRDLKPENLFITKDDRVKILDFGLAKVRESQPTNSGSEDATKKALTDPGVVMGTVGYMSPEQVRGHAADHRSDIFSFGVILYEMLTGRRAFGGDSVVETMHSILKDDVPDLDESGVRVPPSVEKLLRRCLEKKPEHRFHSAHDLGFALDAVSSPTSSSGSGLSVAAGTLPDSPDMSRSNWLGRAAWIVAAVFLSSTFVLAALYFRREAPQSQTMRFTIAPPDKNSFNEAFALSPNGQMIAFVARGTSGDTSLWVRPLTAVDAKQLPGTEGASFPFWSPNSRSIGFFANAKLRKIDAAGGPAQTLADASSDPRGGTWTPDETIIFSPHTTSPLMRVAASGGTVSEVTKLNTEAGQSSHRWPSMLPDGKHFLFFGRGGSPETQGIYAASIDAPEPSLLIATPVAGSYTEADGVGYLMFVREGTLMMQRFDAAKLALSGEARPVIENLLSFPSEIGPTAYSAFSTAAGHLIYRTGDQQTTRLTWHDRSGKVLDTIGEPAGYHEPSLSKDDTKVLFGRSDGSVPAQDVYVHDLSRGSTTRLTFDPEADTTPVFSPDETQVLFYSNRGAKNSFYRKSANGSGNEELILSGDSGSYPDSWSRDGKYLLYERNGGVQTKVDLWVLPMAGEPTPFPYLETPFEEAHAQFSPDGRWVAYTSNDTGRSEVYVESFPRGGGKWQISTAGGDQPQWRSDGKELFYIAPDRNLMVVTIEGSGTLAIGKPAVLFQTSTPLTGITDDRNNYAPSHDGQRFLVNTLADSANLQPLILVLNWAADIKK